MHTSEDQKLQACSRVASVCACVSCKPGSIESYSLYYWGNLGKQTSRQQPSSHEKHAKKIRKIIHGREVSTKYVRKATPTVYGVLSTFLLKFNQKSTKRAHLMAFIYRVRLVCSSSGGITTVQYNNNSSCSWALLVVLFVARKKEMAEACSWLQSMGYGKILEPQSIHANMETRGGGLPESSLSADLLYTANNQKYTIISMILLLLSVPPLVHVSV